jgi:hypothetical protein
MVRPKHAGQAPATDPAQAEALAPLGLQPGEDVRIQVNASARWAPARVTRRERDGSIGVVDQHGAARSLTVERIQVRRHGPRGGGGWEPLAARAGRAEQLSLDPSW